MSSLPDKSESAADLGVDFRALPTVPEGSSLSAEWWIALRHLASARNEASLSVVTLLSVIGVIIAVAVPNVVLSVMSGFETEIRDNILGANAHVVVMGVGAIPEPDALIEAIDEHPGVVGAAPFVYHEVVLQSQGGFKGAVLKGFDPVRTRDVTKLWDDLVDDAGDHLPDAAARDEVFAQAADGVMAQPISGEGEAQKVPGLILGIGIAETLGVRIGDAVRIMDPTGGGTGPMGMPSPRFKNAKVVGIYSSGMYEYDANWVYIANRELQDFLKIDTLVSGIEVSVGDIHSARVVAADLDDALGPLYHARSWQDMNQALYNALKVERQVFTIVVFLVVLIAALLILITLIMMVITKGREIAILKAMGATNAGIMRIFVMQGALIGACGTLLGTALGFGAAFFLDWYGWPLADDVYFVSTLPVELEALNFLAIAAGAFAVCFLATLYPAWRAAAVDPVEGLRYE